MTTNRARALQACDKKPWEHLLTPRAVNTTKPNAPPAHYPFLQRPPSLTLPKRERNTTEVHMSLQLILEVPSFGKRAVSPFRELGGIRGALVQAKNNILFLG